MTGATAGRPGDSGACGGWKPEIELKFFATRETMDALLRKPPLVHARDLGERHIESVYFDTAERRLQRDGVALRVRRVGETYVQTAKMLDPAGHTAFRLETDDPLDGPSPSAALLHRATGSRHLAVGDGDLVAAFRTRFDRRVLMLDRPGSTIEVAIDDGVVESGTKSDAIREIELELVEGEVGDLYRLALALHRQAPLATGVFTKAQRGFALADGLPPPWSKAGAVALEATTSLDETIRRVLARCYEHWMNNQAAALDGRDIEGLHQMRVALRRLRAALDFLGPWLPEPRRSWFRRELKWIAGSLGKARDLDVLRHDILGPLRRASPSDRDLELLDGCIAARRDGAYRRLASRIASSRYTTASLTLGQWIAERGWRTGNTDLDAPLSRHAGGALDRAFGRVVSGGAEFEAMGESERHDLRLDVKRLRYAIQFVGPAYPGAKPMLQVLGKLQDVLGAANDARLAEAVIDRCTGPGRKAGIARARGLVTGWWLAKASERERLSRSLWRDFTNLGPFWA